MTRLPDLLRRLADDPRPDGDLLAAFRQHRDQTAFAAVVRRHGPLVWGTCRRLLPDSADAEDAFQAAFLVLVRRGDRLERSGSVGPWLHRTAVLVCRNLRRKNARRLARTAPLLDDIPVSVPPPAPDLDRLLLALSERDRAAVVLCGLEGLTRQEAADRLGIPEGTVSARLSRGLAKLRRRYAGGLPAVVPVPLVLCESTAKAAAAVGLAAAVSPGVIHLAEGVLRMFVLKKAAAAVGCVLAVGLAMGVGTRFGPATAEDKPATAKAAPAKSEVEQLREELAQLKRELEKSRRQNIDALLELQRQIAATAAPPSPGKVPALQLPPLPKPTPALPPADPRRDRVLEAEARLQAAEAMLKAYQAQRDVARQTLEQAQREAVASSPTPAELVLSVGGPNQASTAPFTVLEKRAADAIDLSTEVYSEAALLRHLRRLKADPASPKAITLTAVNDAPWARTKAAIDAIKAAGFEQMVATAAGGDEATVLMRERRTQSLLLEMQRASAEADLARVEQELLTPMLDDQKRTRLTETAKRLREQLTTLRAAKTATIDDQLRAIDREKMAVELKKLEDELAFYTQAVKKGLITQAQLDAVRVQVAEMQIKMKRFDAETPKPDSAEPTKHTLKVGNSLQAAMDADIIRITSPNPQTVVDARPDPDNRWVLRVEARKPGTADLSVILANGQARTLRVTVTPLAAGGK